MMTVLMLAASPAGGVDGMTITVGAIAAVGVAVAAAVKAFRNGEAKGKGLRVEPQPLAVEISSTLATKKELEDLEGRIVAELKKLESALSNERSVARTANGNLHARIDKTTESLAEVRGELSQINANLNRLVDIAMKHSPPRRTP